VINACRGSKDDSHGGSSNPAAIAALVFGGELTSLETSNLGPRQARHCRYHPNYASPRGLAAKAQQTVDNAHMRYFIVHSIAARPVDTSGGS
jgi:hypothetical protein